MLYYVLRLLFQGQSRKQNFLRCDPVTLVLAALAFLLLMVRCDG